MIGYVTVGADDIARAERFYSSFLLSLGFTLKVSSDGLSYVPVATDDDQSGAIDFYVKPPFDGQPASFGNGAMVAFQMPTQSLVRKLHAAAVAAGGQDEGPPGFRDAYGAHFYVGYVRDPQGNKVALYCNSKTEMKRPD